MKPVRIQMKRIKGFNLQEESRKINGLPVVLVSRPSKWGNPFVVGRDGTLEESIKSYYEWANQGKVSTIRQELKGKNLACWCPIDQSCHADILLKVANE